MLRHKADTRTLAFVGFYYVLLIAEWRLVPVNSGWVIPAIALTASVSWICAVIAHNTLHTPVFRERWANHVFQVVLTCAYGFPVSEYVPGHNLSHHRHTQKRADLMRTNKAPFVRWNVLNLLVFFPRVGMDITAQNYRYVAVAKKALPGWHRQLLAEIAFGWGTKLVLLAIDWRKTLLFVLIPHLWAVYGITTVNFLQHDGCDEDDRYNHSRNFVGRVFNWFTFNNGYHGVHHDRPGLHWSLLPAVHAETMHGKIDPRLEQTSLLAYAFDAFVYPGTRRRFDGTPLTPEAPGADEEWIPQNLRSTIAESEMAGTAMGDAE
jgi:fatty acid desaturase